MEMFDYNDFIHLEKFLHTLELLILFHFPEIYKIFKKNDISVELYATKWMLTFFLTKMDIYLAYTFLEYILLENDC